MGGLARLEAAVARSEGLLLGEGRVVQADGLRQEGRQVVVRHLGLGLLLLRLLLVRVRVRVRLRFSVKVGSVS